MPRLIHKLKRDSAGETLIEVLASILIASVSVALMFGCITASTEFDKNAANYDRAYYNALGRAESAGPGDEADPYPATAPSVALYDIDDEDCNTALFTWNDSANPIVIYGGEYVYSYAR